MFQSLNAADGRELYRREAQTWLQFAGELAELRERQRQFAALGVTERTARLAQFADRLAANQERLAEMVCEEVGRCLHECRAELNKSVELIRYYVRLAPELLAHKTIATQASLSQVRFEPLGTVLAVMPWNYPVWQVLRFAVPAVCAGNACVVKPAPSVARVTAALFEVAGADLPLIPAWLNHEDTLKAIEHTDAMAFTGSTETGRLLAAHAGSHLKKTVLELGGSNAFIVMPDADLAQAAKDACYSRFRDAGQSCNAAKRIIVAEAVADQFIPLFLAECAKLKTGNPKHPDTTLAPLHRSDLREKVHGQVADAVAHGAQCLTGGEIPEGSGWFYPATVLDRVNPDCRVYHEEVFGPVAILLRARDEMHAITLANDSPFGLGACIYTADTERAWQYAEKIQAGSVFINRHTSSDLRLPFGGVKASGYGRELSEFGLYEFVNVKTYWQK
ncbi:aldehyde dehydrogenase family protein [Neisseria animalis]|uniref:Aldehyde dehydrogenase family protein n=1 Tax=Neisseria animalis TaxID=492 RepID=A0A5P3MUA7_NEIAN|nr:aldehyde dehydrogenase family protein [Neisseria animalis]QEY24351.1 aldehyde dehydrogenase family protein [Neisseria animalis]ROW31742.1 aldehyde dehydrogenase family protein [Neisseria animalis]VEE06848.1 aldehyde dehydrogenase [Neisseria animalis]